jgi:hydroxyacyl-ACP dehydratase HTD2-like protein with hotdog domain
LSTNAFTLTDEMRSQVIGVESEPTTLEVERGHVARFAEAIGDDNPAYTAGTPQSGGVVAPPTFLRAIRDVRPVVPFDVPFTRLLDGGSDWEYFEPVRAGDTITAVGRIEDMRERTGSIGQMLISTIKITYRNQAGAIVATQTSTSIRY